MEAIKTGMLDMSPSEKLLRSVIVTPDKPFEAKLAIPGRRKSPLRWNFDDGVPA